MGAACIRYVLDLVTICPCNIRTQNEQCKTQISDRLQIRIDLLSIWRPDLHDKSEKIKSADFDLRRNCVFYAVKYFFCNIP